MDPIVNDVHTLATVNELLDDDADAKRRAHERARAVAGSRTC